MTVVHDDKMFAELARARSLLSADLPADAAFIAALEAVLDARYVPTVAAWTTTFDPVITQSVVVTHTLSKSQWHYDGDMIEWECYLTVTGAGTAANTVTVTMPVAALSAINPCIGAAEIYDSSVPLRYVCAPETASTTTIAFGADQGNANLWGVAPGAGLAVNDQIRFLVRYRWR